MQNIPERNLTPRKLTSVKDRRSNLAPNIRRI